MSQDIDTQSYIEEDKKEFNYKRKPWKGNNAFLYDYLHSISYFGNEDKIRYLVPIHFWIYSDKDGNGAASLSDIKKYIDELNYYNKLNKTGFRFYLSNIKEISKTRRKIMGYYIEAPLQGIFRRMSNVINVHIIDNFKLLKNERRVVRASYSYISKSIVMRKVNSTTSLAHEIGHYFGLLHPHRNYNKGKNKQEPVSRTRTKNSRNKIPLCELRGDYLSDTPAEPKLSFLVDNDCKFVGNTITDSWGDNYKSHTNNIMSYPAHYYCRYHFTTGQIAVMLYTSASYNTSKYWSTDYKNNLKFSFDNSEPNDYFEMASNLKSDTVYSLNFHKIFVKKRRIKTDTCDWYKVELKNDTSQTNSQLNIRISVNFNKNNSNNILVDLFDKNRIKLNAIKIKKDNSLTLEYKNLVEDWYYIKVSQIENKKNDIINKYNLLIINN